MHFSGSIAGFPTSCTLILPALSRQPMPRCFTAPPKPEAGCPLPCDITIMESAWAMAEATVMLLRASPFTCVSFPSPPLSPSATMNGAFMLAWVKPFIAAQVISSAALSFIPRYKVVVSVTKGIPPAFITRSTTVRTITGLICVVLPYSPGWILTATISPALTGEIWGKTLFTCSIWLSSGRVIFAVLNIISFNVIPHVNISLYYIGFSPWNKDCYKLKTIDNFMIVHIVNPIGDKPMRNRLCHRYKR
ncbi:Uncharacterised protein [uncultured archaeon]|nr:Uncharacterised protein [uncultured archaeon]